MKKIFQLAACLAMLNTANAQVGIGISTPNTNAALDISSINKGLLIPRLALNATNVASPLLNFVEGMMLYNTATSGVAPNNVVPGFYINDGTKWLNISVPSFWGLNGNAGTTVANFIGTSDVTPLYFKVNNQKSGEIDLVSRNTGLGFRALFSNIAGNNTAVGFEAMYQNSGGFNNTAVGSGSLSSNISGNNNTTVGKAAMASNTTGLSNSAFGVNALNANISGQRNTAIGNNALVNNQFASRNTATGFQSLFYDSLGNNNAAFGYNALLFNGAGSFNNAFGDSTLFLSTSGNYNTAIGHQALANNTTGNNNIAIGARANVPSATSDNQVRIGDENITYAGVQVAWTITSDSRWKSEIENSNLGLNFISQLRPVSYFRNNDKSRKSEYGFVAQEVEEALINSGVSNTGIISKDDAGMYSIRYNDFTATVVKAIQEQQVIITQQAKEIKELRAMMDKIKDHSGK